MARASAAASATATHMPHGRMKVSSSAFVRATIIVAAGVVMRYTPATTTRMKLCHTPANGINGWNTAAMNADVRKRPMMQPQAREFGLTGGILRCKLVDNIEE